MIRAEDANEAIDIKFDSVGALVADGQEGVSLLDVGEGGGHGLSCISNAHHRHARYIVLAGDLGN